MNTTESPLGVLLIDDDRNSVPLTRWLLLQGNRVPCELDWAATYEQGLDLLLRGKHDVCLLDYRLGPRDGLELLGEAVAAGCRVPVVLLTGQDDENVACRALKAGAVDYLCKRDLSGPALQRSIRYAIERRRGEEERMRALRELEVLTSGVSASLWSTDGDLRIVSACGRGLWDLNGASARPVGRTLYELAKGEDEFLAAHERALRGESLTLEIKRGQQILQVHVSPHGGSGAERNGVVGVALDVTDRHHIEAEFRAARRIQRALLPATAPRVAGFDIAGVCHPADETGGDYFDFMPLPDHSLLTVIADVCGHGFASALIMANTRSLIRTLATADVDPGHFLTVANRALVEDTPPELFVSVFVARLDLSHRTLTYAGAGHEGYLIAPSGTVQRLPSAAPPLGIFPDSRVTASQVLPLAAGEMLLSITDGVYEVTSPEGDLFGLSRVWEVVQKHRQRPAREILEHLINDARSFGEGGRLHDDMTAVLVKVE